MWGMPWAIFLGFLLCSVMMKNAYGTKLTEVQFSWSIIVAIHCIPQGQYTVPPGETA